MTQKEFISILDKIEYYPYEILGNKVVVTHDRDVDLLNDLTSLPPDVEFRNEGHVYLSNLTSLSPGVVFKNVGYVDLGSLTSLPPGVVFNNSGSVYLGSLIGGYFDEEEEDIEGIDPKRLLNLMIKQGVFER
jgi:hypothetical protein